MSADPDFLIRQAAFAAARRLSVRTVFPRSGAKVWYDDQRQVHQQIYQGDDLIDYGNKLHLPQREKDLPDRDRLAMRLDVFRGYEE
jgi:hypothetical protein